MPSWHEACGGDHAGFSVDCLETLEEIGMGLKEEWHENGGTDFAALSCLNAEKPAIDLIETLVRRNFNQGWVTVPLGRMPVTVPEKSSKAIFYSTRCIGIAEDQRKPSKTSAGFEGCISNKGIGVGNEIIYNSD